MKFLLRRSYLCHWVCCHLSVAMWGWAQGLSCAHILAWVPPTFINCWGCNQDRTGNSWPHWLDWYETEDLNYHRFRGNSESTWDKARIQGTSEERGGTRRQNCLCTLISSVDGKPPLVVFLHKMCHGVDANLARMGIVVHLTCCSLEYLDLILKCNFQSCFTYWSSYDMRWIFMVCLH